MPTSTKLASFKINLLTKAQFAEAQAAGTLDENQAYMIIDEDDSLPISGGTLTGTLILAGDPVDDLGAATKQYVDSQISEKVTTALGDIEAELAEI